MSDQKKSIVFVRPNNDKLRYYNLKLSRELDIHVTPVPTIQDVFPLLSDTSFNPTAIAIDIDECFLTDGVDLYDMIHLLSTMLKCTLCRDETVTKKRKTAIVALVSNVTSPSLIRNIISMPGVDHVGLKISEAITYQDVKDDTEQYLTGNFKNNKLVKKMVYTKPHATVKTTVSAVELTPRQSQILQLVKTRGASNKVIARMLNLSESTIKLHLGIIFRKYGVKNRTQLAVSAD